MTEARPEFPRRPPRLSTTLTPLPLDRLRTGVELPSPIYDTRGDRPALLLAGGQRVTGEMITRLRARGVTQLRVDPAALAAIAEPDGVASAPPPAVTRVPVAVAPGRTYGAEALIRTMTAPVALPDAAALVRGTAQRRALTHAVGGLYADVGRGRGVDGAALRAMTLATVERMLGDLDLFARLGLGGGAGAGEGSDGTAHGHGTRTAHLAMAMGVVMGLRREEVEHLAMGCLIHDAGMTRIDPRAATAGRRLDRVEFLEITKHPLKTFDLLQNVPEVPVPARMVAYQMHERWDGSGYPRRRSGTQIHRLSRIAMLADAYCGLTTARPHRAALAPPAAVRTLLGDARGGKFDPDAVRGLLEAVSLYPLGSVVRLSDGGSARVVGVHRTAFTRPVVEPWVPPGGFTPAGRWAGATIDLSDPSRGDLHVVGPAATAA